MGAKNVGAKNNVSLEAVRQVLEAAVNRGELSQSQASWSLNRLAEGPAPPVPRTDGSNRRDDLVQAAIEIFDRRGYSRATLEEVGSRVGLTKSTVYHYFASKAELLDAICDEAMSSAEAAFDAGLRMAADPADRVREALTRYAHVVARQRSLTVVMRNLEELTPNFQRHNEQRRRAMVRELAAALEEGIQSGVLASADSQVAALTAFGAINWLYTRYKPTGRLSPEEVCDLLVTQIMSGLLPRKREPRPASRQPSSQAATVR